MRQFLIDDADTELAELLADIERQINDAIVNANPHLAARLRKAKPELEKYLTVGIVGAERVH